MDERINPESITEQDMMNEFMQITNRSLEQDELTVNSFRDKMEIPRNRARYILAKYEQKGLLKYRKVKVDSSVVNAYSPSKGTWKDVVEIIKQE